MAILKHINLKNKDYSASVRYLWFQHDEKTGKPLRGEDGHCIRREGVIMDSLNCGIISFGFDCWMANKKYGKNQQEREIRAHHWILSFSPEDYKNGKLTPERAQELGMEFAQKHFDGHQCIIATHNDGHNGSKNIHVHIVCNSLRIKDLPEQPPYSQFERDRKAGYKLHPTREMMEYLKEDVMRLCHENGLQQVDLNKRAKKHITDKEYRAQQRGQEKLDKANEEIKTNGETPKKTKFKTDLEEMREAIDAARERSESVEEFMRILEEEYQITVTQSRGRWSYLPVGRKRPVTWRRLGTNYGREYIEEYIKAKLRQQPVEPTIQKPSHVDAAPALPVMGRMIDLNDPKIQASYGLTQWAKIQNLKEMSKKFNIISEMGLLSVEKLENEIVSQKKQLSDGKEELKAVEGRIKEINMLRRLLAQYYSTRSVYNEYRRSYKSPAFREQHISEITLYEGAQKQLNQWLKEHNGMKIPSDTQLKKEKAMLSEKKDRLYEERKELRSSISLLEDANELFTSKSKRTQVKQIESSIE